MRRLAHDFRKCSRRLKIYLMINYFHRRILYTANFVCMGSF